VHQLLVALLAVVLLLLVLHKMYHSITTMIVWWHFNINKTTVKINCDLFLKVKYFLASISNFTNWEIGMPKIVLLFVKTPESVLFLLKILNKFPANSTLASKKNGFW
jgi:hypothetical protein